MKISYILLFVIILFLFYLIYANKKIKVTNYSFSANENIRIVHLSDIHNDLFGKNNCRLIDVVKKCKPDLIFITGDLLDRRRTNEDRAYYLIKKLSELANVYYVTGNHESKIKNYSLFEQKMKSIDINVLNNEYVEIKGLRIYGLKDAGFYPNNKNRGRIIMEEQLNKMNIIKDNEHINILLVHRPHYFLNYSKYPFDYIFCGHAHGGQMRLPFIGGLYAPGQGVLPKYDSGIYKNNGSTMILSRGIGNSLFPLRIFNNPEVITVDFTND